MASDPRREYSRRIERWTGEIARGERTSLRLSNSRLIVAAALAIIGWQAFVSHRVSAIWPVAVLVAFGVLVILHARVLNRIEQATRARQLYERGMARLDFKWAGTGPDGARFLEGHPFARDLDLFGPASLFQLLDTARTEVGEETLASWLASGAPSSEVVSRQGAVGELKPKVDFREDLAVLAAGTPVGKTDAVAMWAASMPVGLSRVHALLFGICALVSAVVTGLVLAERISLTFLIAWIVVQSIVATIVAARVETVLSRIDSAEHALGLMAVLFGRIEREQFTSARLVESQLVLATDGIPPSRRIAQLRRLVAFVDDASRNLLLRPLGALLLLRGQAAVWIDRWHARNGRAIIEWLRAVGEIEALAALATYAYEHPGDPFPKLIDEGPLVNASGVGHPLIDERTGVRNDVRLGPPYPSALIVSGSNMSGKSTLLRAVGVNVVLALAGAPVRATEMALSWLSIGATIRVDDSLQEGHSRFYTEILRIRTIVELARERRLVLFLLDEILGGTNSHDRRIGAEAILVALVEAGAIGLITTHDLALTELAARLPSRVENVHFEDRIEDGAMVFDYRMRPGVVERSNAVALMRAVGLDV
jgi:MutS domain V